MARCRTNRCCGASSSSARGSHPGSRSCSARRVNRLRPALLALRRQQDELDAAVLLAGWFGRVAGDRTELREAGGDQARAGELAAVFEEADDVGGARGGELPVGWEAFLRLRVRDAHLVGVSANLDGVILQAGETG